MLGVYVGAILGALLSGALGYTLAVVKRDTAIALLQQGLATVNIRLDRVDSTIINQNRRIDEHLRIIQRLLLDIARKAGADIRVADVLEITALEPEGKE